MKSSLTHKNKQISGSQITQKHKLRGRTHILDVGNQARTILAILTGISNSLNQGSSSRTNQVYRSDEGTIRTEYSKRKEAWKEGIDGGGGRGGRRKEEENTVEEEEGRRGGYGGRGRRKRTEVKEKMKHTQNQQQMTECGQQQRLAGVCPGKRLVFM